ncbi:thioredoxin family protein [Seonamhaeicola marinus]|uniref:Thioredoxin family protein n=1 Tax=Seonamhaeicola marinus TaxID=1912246 RepID=A0A5D0IRH2_9FLAO|nr:thioredoxin family protein [Seonamhaeicola marinus]TYA84242.1 thioredoxin family protein [Seonamhaeicola marinus]
MKSSLLTILCCIVALHLYAQVDSGIEFFSGSFEKAIKAAKAQNKSIFIDFSTSWCGPCRQMDSFVFTDSVIGDFYNKNFICLKYDAEKGEGITMANKYKVSVFPTLLFLSPEPDIKLKHIGYKGPQAFLELGHTNANSSNNTIPTALSDYNAGIESIIEFSSFVAYLSPLEKDAFLLDYFQDIPKSKWYTPQYFHLIEIHSHSIFATLPQFVIVNRKTYSEIYGNERIDKFINGLMSFALKSPRTVYGESHTNLSNLEIKNVLIRDLTKIDSVFADKNKLNQDIALLCKTFKENHHSTDIWDSLFSKVEHYNKHYSPLDEQWYNFSNDWFYRAISIISSNLEKKRYNETCLNLAKSKLSESDYHRFEEGLCRGTVEKFVAGRHKSENSKIELALALRILATSYPVSKLWANDFLSKINVLDKDIIAYKETLIKKAM